MHILHPELSEDVEAEGKLAKAAGIGGLALASLIPGMLGSDDKESSSPKGKWTHHYSGQVGDHGGSIDAKGYETDDKQSYKGNIKLAFPDKTSPDGKPLYKVDDPGDSGEKRFYSADDARDLTSKLLFSPADSVATADAQDWDKTKLQKFGGKLKGMFTR